AGPAVRPGQPGLLPALGRQPLLANARHGRLRRPVRPRARLGHRPRVLPAQVHPVGPEGYTRPRPVFRGAHARPAQGPGMSRPPGRDWAWGPRSKIVKSPSSCHERVVARTGSLQPFMIKKGSLRRVVSRSFPAGPATTMMRISSARTVAA